MVIFSAPSGSGKTTLVRFLLSRLPALAFSVSATSREPREGEVDGRDYWFLSREDFRKKISEGAFAEWEEVYPGTYYGTLRSEIDRIWALGKQLIFDVDVKGGLNLKKQYGDQALAIFVMPPSLDVLEKRLRDRCTDSEEKIQERIGKAAHEMESAPLFDHILVNDRLEDARAEALALVEPFIDPGS